MNHELFRHFCKKWYAIPVSIHASLFGPKQEHPFSPAIVPKRLLAASTI
jgi:hypothetical protein